MIYLFDWGNTLMVDFPHAQGKMCDWEYVETVPQAKETLAQLTQHHQVISRPVHQIPRWKMCKKPFNESGSTNTFLAIFALPTLGLPRVSLIFILRSQNNWALSRANLLCWRLARKRHLPSNGRRVKRHLVQP